MPRHRFLSAIAVTIALVALAACGEDYPDAYTAADGEPVATRAPVPSDAPVDAAEASVPDEPEPESFPATGEVEEVWAIDNTFRVDDIEVEAGTEVLWINRGRNEHDVKPVDESQGWGIAKDGFVPGDEYGHVFDTPGVYDYYCTLHATTEVGMIGRVVVVPPET